MKFEKNDFTCNKNNTLKHLWLTGVGPNFGINVFFILPISSNFSNSKSFPIIITTFPPLLSQTSCWLSKTLVYNILNSKILRVITVRIVSDEIFLSLT